MAHLDRRTISDLVALHTLEPDLFDVIVEGPADATIVSWFLRAERWDHVKVYAIESYDVPPDLVQGLGLAVGNKGRLQAFAFELNRVAPGGGLNVRCIADRDLDSLFGLFEVPNYLWYTDGSDMESYLFREEVLEKLFRLVLRRPDIDIPKMLDELSGILIECFLMRAAVRELGMNTAPMPVDHGCSVKSGRLVFDRRLTFRDWTISRGLGGRVVELEHTIDTLRARARGLGDIRRIVNGHDFVELLWWYVINVLRVRIIRNIEVFVRALTACLELRQLEEERTFSNLSVWAVTGVKQS